MIQATISAPVTRIVTVTMTESDAEMLLQWVRRLDVRPHISFELANALRQVIL